MNLNENTKITLTIGQLKKLVKESRKPKTQIVRVKIKDWDDSEGYCDSHTARQIYRKIVGKIYDVKMPADWEGPDDDRLCDDDAYDLEYQTLSTALNGDPIGDLIDYKIVK